MDAVAKVEGFRSIISLVQVIFALGLYLVSSQKNPTDSYTESLQIKALPTGHIYTHFQFIVKDEQLNNHTHLFPRALAEILSAHSVHELHFTLTQGHWRTKFWAEPFESAPSGAQVIAWFNSDNEESAGKNWKGLTSRLSGLTCASLNFLDDTTSITPKFSYRPRGNIFNKKFEQPLFVRVGSLPKEHICTENLTPWAKLLPCGVSHGLASFLKTKQVFDTNYHSAGIHFVETDEGIELKLTLSIVFEVGKFQDADNFARKTFGPIGIFPCQPASSTFISIWNSSINVWKQIDVNEINSLKLGDIPKEVNESLDLIFTPNKYLGGYGQERGEIIVEMVNHLPTQSLPVLYVEVLPWYVRPYLHTMKVDVVTQGTESVPKSITGPSFHYTPGRDRTRLHKLEMDFVIPPKSTITVRITVEKRHLKWDEYPPDANHGFYLEPAHFEVNYTDPLNEDATTPLYYYSRKLLVNLSTPDFSMPYNVICLTCTVVALAFGPLHNITTKVLQHRAITTVKISEVVKNIGLKVWGLISRTRKIVQEPLVLTTKEMTDSGSGSE